MAFIRAYRPSSDDEDIIHIFRETAHPELAAAGDRALHHASYNWARPYMMLVPEHCFVIDDGTGRAVGYVLGVPDTRLFVDEYKARYLPSLAAQGIMQPSPSPTPESGESVDMDMALSMQRITWAPEAMLMRDFPRVLEEYPAHLHIDILPSHQGGGFGRKMVEMTLARFRDMGVSGLHLGKVGTNIAAGQFYLKLGFERFPEVMDGGDSGEVGRVKEGGVCMVKKL